MNFVDQLNVGLAGYSKAHNFIKQHKLYHFFLIPIVLNVALFLLVTTWGWSLAGDVSEWLYATVGLEGADWGSFNFLKTVIQFTVSIVLKIMLLLIYMTTFRYIILILLAPVLAYISERVEELITGREYPFNFVLLMQDAWRGIVIAVSNGIKEIGITILLFLFGFIPLVGFITPFAAYIVESYYYGFSMIDYYGERQRWTARTTSRFIWRVKGIAIANGAVFNALLLGTSLISSFFPLFVGFLIKAVFILPLIGLSVAPIYSVIAATLSILELPEADVKAITDGKV